MPIKVNVTPFERKELAHPQTGARSQQHERSLSQWQRLNQPSLDTHEMGNLGDKTEGQILFADESWGETTREPDRKLGSNRDPGSKIPGGEVMNLRSALARFFALFRQRRLDRE